MRTLIFLFFVTSLFARINPFVPTTNVENVTNNKEEDPGFFTKEQIFLPSTARILKKIIVVHQNLDGTIEEVAKEIDKKIDWHEPIEFFQQESEISKRKYSHVFRRVSIDGISFITVDLSKRALLLNCKDKMIRSFMLTEPYRIVIDFKRDSTFYSKSKEFADSYFKKIVIGNHGTYYRAVIYLDNYYDYKLEKKEKGYLIELTQ